METREPVSEVAVPALDECLGQGQRCPLCSRDNDCRVAKGHLYKGPCWCHTIIVPNDILTRLAEGAADPACLCRSCLETMVKISREVDSTEQILALAQKTILTNRADQNVPTEPDFYLDEQGNTVFTASYHLRRGTCCQSECRHCPYPG